MHEPERRMHPVMVVVQTLPKTRPQLQALRLPVPQDLERRTRLDAGQHADQSLGDAVSDRDLLGHLLLASLGRLQVAHLPAQRLRLVNRRRLDPLGPTLATAAPAAQLAGNGRLVYSCPCFGAVLCSGSVDDLGI